MKEQIKQLTSKSTDVPATMIDEYMERRKLAMTKANVLGAGVLVPDIRHGNHENYWHPLNLYLLNSTFSRASYNSDMYVSHMASILRSKSSSHVYHVQGNHWVGINYQPDIGIAIIHNSLETTERTRDDIGELINGLIRGDRNESSSLKVAFSDVLI